MWWWLPQQSSTGHDSIHHQTGHQNTQQQRPGGEVGSASVWPERPHPIAVRDSVQKEKKKRHLQTQDDNWWHTQTLWGLHQQSSHGQRGGGGGHTLLHAMTTQSPPTTEWSTNKMVFSPVQSQAASIQQVREWPRQWLQHGLDKGWLP